MISKNRQLSILNNLISGLAIIILGIIVIVGSINIYTKVINLFVYIFIIIGLSELGNFLIKKKIVRNFQILLRIILNIVFGFIMLLFPKIPLSILPIVFSLYLLFNAIVKFINYLILLEVNLKSRFKELFFCLFFLVFCFIFLIYPLKYLNVFIMLMGIYCLIYGLNRIYQFLLDVLTKKYKLKIKNKIRITLPALFEAFIPKRALNTINKYLDNLVTDDSESIKDSDLSIFIHLSNYGFNQFGHMDIMFDKKIYSYGNYDKSSQKLFTAIGDGVLFELTNKQEYIEFCIENSKKTIVEFGIKLTKKQKENLQNDLKNIKNDSEEWYPLIKQGVSKKQWSKDYSSKLYNITKANFYKFKSGIYKKYFVLGINCTYFIDMLLRNNVFEVLKRVGIISPGTYYEYLDELYNKKCYNVVSKKIYTKENVGDIYDKNKK